MSRYTFCQSSAVAGNWACQSWRPEDIARLARVMFATARIAIVALIVAIVLVVTVRWALPFQISPGNGGASHFAVQPATMSTGDQDVDRAAEQLLTRFENAAMGGNGMAAQPRDLP